jgi:hypothetical protein
MSSEQRYFVRGDLSGAFGKGITRERAEEQAQLLSKTMLGRFSVYPCPSSANLPPVVQFEDGKRVLS